MITWSIARKRLGKHASATTDTLAVIEELETMFSVRSLLRLHNQTRPRVRAVFLFVRDKPILTSESVLHKDYDRKGSVAKRTLVMSFKRLGAKTN
jgi:hypothetical protein